jgi:hypothetical protein
VKSIIPTALRVVGLLHLLGGVLSVAAIAGCDRSAPAATIVVAGETLDTARDAGFDYLGVLGRAENGDRASLAELLRFSDHTDAAASLGHGVVLVELLDVVGDQAFAETATREDRRVRDLVARTLEAGIVHATSARLQRPLAVQAPETAALLQDSP